VGGIIAWLASYAVPPVVQDRVDFAKSRAITAINESLGVGFVAQSDAEREEREAITEVWRKKCEARTEAVRKECEARTEALSNERDQKILGIVRTGASIVLTLWIVAGVWAMAGVIMVSYWLGTGGTRPRGIE
jgi:hypothetical protein